MMMMEDMVTPPWIIHARAEMPDSSPGRQAAIIRSPMTPRKSAAEPHSITHHNSAMDAAAGPAGSSAESGPAQPASSNGAAPATQRLIRRPSTVAVSLLLSCEPTDEAEGL
jgi:hypothetical protein